MGLFTVIAIVVVIVLVIAIALWLYSIFNEKEPVNNTKDFGESCESTDECMVTASTDNQVRLECFMIEGEGTCLTSSIDHCTAFDIDIRGAIYNECTACEEGFFLVNGRCHDIFNCPDGYALSEQNGIPGCYLYSPTRGTTVSSP